MKLVLAIYFLVLSVGVYCMVNHPRAEDMEFIDSADREILSRCVERPDDQAEDTHAYCNVRFL